MWCYSKLAYTLRNHMSKDDLFSHWNFQTTDIKPAQSVSHRKNGILLCPCVHARKILFSNLHIDFVNDQSNPHTCFTSGARGRRCVVTRFAASPIEHKIGNSSFRREQIMDGRENVSILMLVVMFKMSWNVLRDPNEKREKKILWFFIHYFILKWMKYIDYYIK